MFCSTAPSPVGEEGPKDSFGEDEAKEQWFVGEKGSKED